MNKLKFVSLTILGAFLVWPTQVHTPINNKIYKSNFKEQTVVKKIISVHELKNGCCVRPYYPYYDMTIDVRQKGKNGYTEKNKSNTYNTFDLYLLAKLITAEAGSEWLSDDLQLYVGQVVLNRVQSKNFPNTIHDVIYQKGQYDCVRNGHINQQPTKRAIMNARKLLEGERVLPVYVYYQAEFCQGNVYRKVYDKVLRTTTYFCY